MARVTTETRSSEPRQMTAEVLVIDASAAVDLLVETVRADRIRRRLRGARLVVPASFDVEVQSALRGLERSGAVDASRVDQARRALERMPAARSPLQPLADAAWALRHRISLYDAQYVALAESAAAPLLTTDARLARAGDLGISLLLIT